jgi:hypothetical protein
MTRARRTIWRYARFVRALRFFVATAIIAISLAPIACATAEDNSGTSFDGGHGDTAHGDVGSGSDTDTTGDSSTSSDTRDGGSGDTGGGIDTFSADTSSIDTTVSIDTAIDDTGIDTGHDTGVDTTPDSVFFDSPLDGGTTVEFPSASSTTHNSIGTLSTLGAGGGGAFYVTGDYCEQTFPRSTTVTRLDMNFRMSDLTSGCAVGATNTWNVKLNGTVVGSYSWVSESPAHGDRSIVESYTFAAVSPVAGNVTIRIEATTTVCPGGVSWNWYPGGTTTMD